ncbi:MAG TPA: hypothetical protein VKA67_02355, partial [Verrucomicrobiae bacterium]|nr:hypothetical protein [Verrucomicrobiae bacterium]
RQYDSGFRHCCDTDYTRWNLVFPAFAGNFRGCDLIEHSHAQETFLDFEYTSTQETFADVI